MLADTQKFALLMGSCLAISDAYAMLLSQHF